MQMDSKQIWQYDEFKQVGTDYCSRVEVDIYDSRHADFRDIEAESRKVLDMLDVKSNDVLLDFGSGTGTFAIQTAKRFKRVHAIDVSLIMIEHAKTKADKAGVANIMFHHAGFLTYEHNDTPADAIVTTFAFHHLPDYWKGIALKRMNSMLNPGGLLYIHDVIIEEANSINNIQALIDKLAKDGGEQLREDTERHFREEYSTYDWVMDELLARSGFQVKSKQIEGGVLGTYLCTRSL
jgi:putative AdoMet-dependent methyltransferase